MKYVFHREGSEGQLFTAFDSTKFRKTDVFRIHHHADLELGYIVSGEGEYILEGRSYEARAGRLFLVRTGEQHCVPTIGADELVSFNFHITHAFLWDFCGEYIRPEALASLIGKGDIIRFFDGLGEDVMKIRALCEEQSENRFEIKFLLLSLIKKISDILPVGLSEAEKDFNFHHADGIRSAVSYIGEHFSESISVDDLAKRANLGRSRFDEIFKSMTGTSPYEYIVLRRADAAAELLRSTDSSVTDIAEVCGFGGQANFYKTFKRITGLSPREYRKTKR